MKSLIVVPTFEEVDNIDELVGAIWSHAPGNHILFVDDNSQDGTRDKIEAHRAAHGDLVHALYRPGKMGLGTAYIEGFTWALERDYDAVIEMDADLSHDPSVLPRIHELLGEYDVVIGSRYVPGGGTVNWGPLRRFISRMGGVYARAILGMKVADPTGGYNAWRREVIERIDLESIESEGYSFQIELKYRASKAGFRLHETPIVFEDRRAGQSKMSNRIIVEAMIRVLHLRFAGPR